MLYANYYFNIGLNIYAYGLESLLLLSSLDTHTLYSAA